MAKGEKTAKPASARAGGAAAGAAGNVTECEVPPRSGSDLQDGVPSEGGATSWVKRGTRTRMRARPSAWLQKDLDAKRQKRAGGRLTPFRALLVFFPLIFITYSE